jgi:osmotically-inducible protein OsmY
MGGSCESIGAAADAASGFPRSTGLLVNAPIPQAVPAPRPTRAAGAAAAVALLLGVAGVLAGCTTAAVGGGATAAVAAAEERGLDGAIYDGRIQTTINYKWLEYDKDMFAALNTSIYERRVLLTGVATSEEKRNAAVRLAWEVRGVKEVINEIIVDPSGTSGTYARDTWISAQLRSKILFDKDIDAINYSIDTVRGTVYLLGVAQSRAEVDRVINHARNLEYVTKVVNYVMLKDDPRRAQ